LRAGHCFIGFDFLGDSSGFSFSATNGQDRRIQGDEISLRPDTRLHVETPVPSRVVLLRNGTVFTMESDVTSKDFPIYEPGVYRAEVYLPQLGPMVENQPWIISNPIYVR